VPTRLSEALINEASAWIAAQMTEEGLLVSEGLVDVVLRAEWDLLAAGLDPDDRPALLRRLGAHLAQAGVMVGPSPMTASTEGVPTPEAVPPAVIAQIVSWEDEFLGLARISRRG